MHFSPKSRTMFFIEMTINVVNFLLVISGLQYFVSVDLIVANWSIRQHLYVIHNCVWL